MKYDYDLICIGLGPGGMAVSIMGSEMGLKVCAIEKHKIGGECMNCGCISSKALLRMAQFRHNVGRLPVMQLEELSLPHVKKPFEKIGADVRFINEQKNRKMFEKVDLILNQGAAEFVDPHTVRVGDRQITARRIFLAVGTKAAILPIPGINTIDGLLTNENLFVQERIPESLAILGGGAIACEMAQAFHRLGTDVTLIQRSGHILSKADPEAARLVENALRAEGVNILTGETAKQVEKRDGKIRLTLNSGKEIIVEKLLAATGRTRNYSGLKLENAGIVYDENGIKVNRHLQTTQPHIYAVGDCNGYHLFSHAAMHQGMIALMNCMSPRLFRQDFRKFVVPATMFTEPQVSEVGMSERELKAKGIRYETHMAKYEDYGAAIAEEVKTGFVKVFCSKFGKLYGAVIVGEGSGEMINEWGLAIQNRIRMHRIMFLQHSFPTMSFLSKRVSEMWMMDKMKSGMLKACCRFFFKMF